LSTAPNISPSGIDRRAGLRADFTAVVRGVTVPIDSGQLKQALGGADIFTSQGNDGTTVVLANVDQAALDAAVAAVVAAAPGLEAARTAAASNDAALRQRLQAALADNAAYLALPAPATKDVVAQVALLTRECSAMIRRGLDILDSTAGT
jgi:hypothetical protein